MFIDIDFDTYVHAGFIFMYWHNFFVIFLNNL